MKDDPQQPPTPALPEPLDELEIAIEAWKQKHGLLPNDPALWLLELFQIHRDRWEAEIQPDVLLNSDDRDLLVHVAEKLNAIKPQIEAMATEIRRLKGGTAWMPPARLAIVLGIASALGTGILIGRFLL